MPEDAFERAVGALGHREHTTAELAAWLAERGFPPAEVEGAIERLTAIGELDDERFARRYAEDKRELRGWGADRIREALAAKGLDRATVEAAVGVEADEDELERALLLLERRGEPAVDEASRSRALGFLARRGYESEVAYEAVRAYERRAA
ncbi:MAG: regulatory protein RecX [Solirubrobacterales bacterium]